MRKKTGKMVMSVMLAAAVLLSGCQASPKTTESGNSAESSTADLYPGKELRIIVPFQTGGALDVQVRTMAKYLSKELDTNVVIENIKGAGGRLGTVEYLKEEANTSTLLLTDGWLTTITPLMEKVEYSMEDFIPVIDHNVVDFALFANPSKTGITDFDGLKAYGEKNKVLFGSAGPGTSLYVIQKSLLDQLEIQSDTITQNGTAEGLANLIAGTVDVSVSGFSDAQDYVESGEIVPILYFGESTYEGEYAYANGLPCAKDNEIGITHQGFYYYSIRKGTDKAIVDKLYEAISNVYADPEFIAEEERVGFKALGLNSEEITNKLNEYSEMGSKNFNLE